MKKLNFLLLMLLVLFTTTSVYASELSIKSNNAILYNLNDDRILFEKNKDQKTSIASLTKLMTALVAVEKIDDINKKVSFINEDYAKLLKYDAVSSSLKKNKTYTYEDLLYGLILESGADCANALARLTYGNEAAFVKKMNEKASKLGMKNTKFANPIGLDDVNNYSTVYDVSILLKADLNNDILKEIITSLSYKLSDGTTIYHTIYGYMKTYKIDMPYIEGGKTGYEISSGYALASLATKDNTTLMFITSHAKDRPDHVLDAKTAYEYYFKNYSYVPLVKKGDTIVTLNTKYLSKDHIDIKITEDVTYYTENEYSKDDVKILYDGDDTITLSNHINDKLGDAKVYYKDELIYTYPVVLKERVYPDIKITAAILGTSFLSFSDFIRIRIVRKRKLKA